MIRLTALLTVTAALAGFASAVVCTPSETHYGSRLLKIDPNNRKAAAAALTTCRQPTDDTHVNQSVFWCVPPGVPAGDSGLLFVTYCGPSNICQEGGALGGVGDACSASTALPARFR